MVRIAARLGEENAGDMAAGIAYYAVLAIFPLLLGIIALLGLFLPESMVQSQVFNFFEQYIPGSSQFIEHNIAAIIKSRGALGAVSILGLLWMGSTIFDAISRAVNRAWGIHGYRPYYFRKLRGIGIAVSASLSFYLSMALTAFASIVPVVSLPLVDSLAIFLSRLASFGLVFCMMMLMYKYMPHTKTSWRYIWPGAVLSTVLFEIARSAFTVYLAIFATYNLVYGSVETIIVLLVWVYISAFIIILGAAFTSEYGKSRRPREKSQNIPPN